MKPKAKEQDIEKEKASDEASGQEAGREAEKPVDQGDGAEHDVRQPEKTKALPVERPPLKIAMPVIYRDINDVLLPATIFSHNADTATIIAFNNAGHSIALPRVKRGIGVGEFWHDEDVLRAAIALEKD